MKTGDSGLMYVVDREVKKHQKELRIKRESEKLAVIHDKLKDEKIRAELSAKPHPFSWRAQKGETLLNYVEYCLTYGGHTKVFKLAKELGI